MSKKVWTKTTAEFVVKWADRKDLGAEEIVDMISDMLAILQELEKRK